MLKQVFKFKLTWAALTVSLLMAMLMAFSYLGAFLDPTDNTHNLPLALVNADQGVALAGQNLNYGQQIVARLTAPQASDAVQWYCQLKKRALAKYEILSLAALN